MATCDNVPLAAAIEGLEEDMSYLRVFVDSESQTATTPDGNTQFTITGILAQADSAITAINTDVATVDAAKDAALTSINDDVIGVSTTAQNAYSQIENELENIDQSVASASASATNATQSAAEAEQSAIAAQAAANYAGVWSQLTGALIAGSTVFHSGVIWVLLVDVANITASEPSGTNADWLEAGDYFLRNKISRSELLESFSKKSTLYSDFAGNTYRLYGGQTKRIDEAVLGQIWDVQRASPAWGFDASGRIVEYAPNEPRLRFDPATGKPEGLLIEEERTNLLLWSENFSDSYWSKPGVTITSSATEAPNGLAGASKLVESAVNENHYLRSLESGRIQAGENASQFVFLKQAERRYVSLSAGAFSATGVKVTVDLQEGVIVSEDAFGGYSLSSPFMEPAGGGWYKVGFSFVDNTNPTRIFYIGLADSLPVITNTEPKAYLGDGTSGVYIWGAQLEVGPSSSSYIKNEGTAVTRTPDIPTRTLGSEFNPNEGTFVIEFEAERPASISRILYFSDGTSNNRIAISQFNTGAFSISHTVEGVNTSLSVPYSEKAKIAVSFDGERVSASGNGSLVNSAAVSGSPIGLDRADLFSFLGGGQTNGTLESVKYFPHAVSNAELQELSTL